MNVWILFMRILDHKHVITSVDWFEFQVSDSEVIESRKIKVKEKAGQGHSGKGPADQSVSTPNKNRTGSSNGTGSDNRKQAEVNGNLSDDENIAGDDLDKMLLDKAICTGPDRKRKRRTRTMDNNCIVVRGGPRNMDNDNNNNSNSTEEIKSKTQRQTSKSDSEATSAGNSGKRDAVLNNIDLERQRKTPAKDRNIAKADSAKTKTPVKNPESFKTMSAHGKTPIQESRTAVKNNYSASKTTDAGRKTPMGKNNSNGVTKETDSRTGDNDDNDDEDFRSCASSPQQLVAAQQQVPQPQNRSSPGTAPAQPKSRAVGAGKTGKKKLFSRSPELFDEETKLLADKRHSRESVSLKVYSHTRIRVRIPIQRDSLSIDLWLQLYLEETFAQGTARNDYCAHFIACE